ncbi:hypothetical protein ACQCSX_08530 [Pseudarthrobacter sp. P1]
MDATVHRSGPLRQPTGRDRKMRDDTADERPERPAGTGNGVTPAT